MNNNYNVIKDRYPKLYNEYICKANATFDNEKIRAYIDTSADGNDIVTFMIDNKYRYINSRYAPLDAAGVWAEQFRNYNPMGVIISVGIGNGIHIREMLKVISDTTRVMVIEPSLEMFNIVMNEFDISDILADPRVVLEVYGVSDGVYGEFLEMFVNYGNYRYVNLSPLPNYDKVFEKECINIYNKFKSHVEMLVLDRNTHVKFSGQFINNLLMNYKDVVNQYTINGLKETFDSYALNDIPAIIVSAGPSLDKNVRELKRAEGKAFIIVVDTALKPVLNAGVRPDISIIVDPHKPLILFDHPDIKDIPMVASYKANYKVLQKQEAPRFYFGDDTEYLGYIYKKYAKLDIDALETGGSVANNAFSLARYLGFKTIIFVGQDLAFSGEQSHVASAYSEKVNKAFMTRKAMETKVEDINGNMVSTLKNMELYLRWFENEMAKYPDMKFIDATEGGARKKGTIIMPLADAINEECVAEFDASEVIEKVHKAFDDSQIEMIYQEFRAIPDELTRISKKLDEGRRQYYRFEELYRKGKTQTAEFARCVQNITEINTLIDNEPLGELIGMYNAQDNFDVAEDMFDFKRNEQDEIRAITDKGITMLNSYIGAIEKLSKDIPILLNTIDENADKYNS